MIALDILLTGEQKHRFSSSHFGTMLMATAGERALGVAVSQLDAIAGLNRDKNITLVGKGRFSGTIALMTAALKHSADVAEADLAGLPVSLKLLIENKIEYENCPGLYCFGLLRHFDIRECIGMAVPSDVHVSDFIGDRERAEKEFEPLNSLYGKWENAGLEY